MADVQANTISATGAITGTTFAGAVIHTTVTLTYGTTVNIDASKGDIFLLTITDGVAFTMNAPTNPTMGKIITFYLKNTSGGATGTITWDAIFKMGAFGAPTNGNQRSINFVYTGTNWLEQFKSAADIPN